MNVTIRSFCMAGFLAVLGLVSVGEQNAEAFRQTRARQYYGTWSYNPIQRYHLRSYYYLPTINTTTYSYHYVVHYPTQPRYYYYYNPVSRHYWGRYDSEAKGYSMLDEKDRKEKLEDIPEKAFPKPAKMPGIPEAKDDIVMEAPPLDAPKDEPKK